MRTRDTQDCGLAGAIGGPGEPGRHRALQDGQRTLPAFQGHGEAHARSKACGPAVHDDHTFWREQRAVHEGSVTRLLDVARQQSLEAGDSPLIIRPPRTGEIDGCDIGGRHDRTRAQLIDDFRGHGVALEARHGGGRGAGKDVAHSAASSLAE